MKRSKQRRLPLQTYKSQQIEQEQLKTSQIKTSKYLIYSTGYPPGSGSYSGLFTRSGGVCWALFRPTCEISAVRPRVAAPSIQWNGRHPLSLFPEGPLPQGRPVHSRWLIFPLALRLLRRVHSDTFFYNLKTLLYSRARIESVLE